MYGGKVLIVVITTLCNIITNSVAAVPYVSSCFRVINIKIWSAYLPILSRTLGFKEIVGPDIDIFLTD